MVAANSVQQVRLARRRVRFPASPSLQAWRRIGERQTLCFVCVARLFHLTCVIIIIIISPVRCTYELIVSVSLPCVQLSVMDVRRCPAMWTQVVRRSSISFKAECSSPTRDVDLVSRSQISIALRAWFAVATQPGPAASPAVSVEIRPFTALHGMQTRSSDENTVCPSVCPSVKRVHCDKTEERSVQIFISYERSFRIVFFRKRMVGGGDIFYLKFWANRPRWSEIADFEHIIARSASAVTPSEKKFN